MKKKLLLRNKNAKKLLSANYYKKKTDDFTFLKEWIGHYGNKNTISKCSIHFIKRKANAVQLIKRK